MELPGYVCLVKGSKIGRDKKTKSNKNDMIMKVNHLVSYNFQANASET